MGFTVVDIKTETVKMVLLSIFLLSMLRFSNDDIYFNFIQTRAVNYLSCLLEVYLLIALRIGMKGDALTNKHSNGFHDEDFDDEMDTASDCCRICRGFSEAASKLIHPCNCSGSMMYVHFNCLKNWFKFSTSITNVIYTLFYADVRNRKSLSCASCRSQYKGLIVRKKPTPVCSYIWNDPWNLNNLFYGPSNSIPTSITMASLCVLVNIYFSWTSTHSDDLILLLLRIADCIFASSLTSLAVTIFLELGVEFVDLEMSYILVGHETFITRDFIQRQRLNETTETANEESNMNRQ